MQGVRGAAVLAYCNLHTTKQMRKNRATVFAGLSAVDLAKAGEHQRFRALPS